MGNDLLCSITIQPTGRWNIRKDLTVAALISLTIIGALGFAVIYALSGQIQLAALALGFTFATLAAALVVWEHELMAPVETTEDMAPMLRSADPPRDAAAEALVSGAAVVVGRRPWLVKMLFAAGATIGVALLFPLRSLTPKIGDTLKHTTWSRGVRLVREDGSIVKATDLEVNSITTVFPEGHTGAASIGDMANAATVLVRVPPEELALPAGRADWAPQGLVAYSKVCTHAGCAVALYRAAARQLLCPCHQSTFDVLRGGTPLFGPAARALPQLPLSIAADGSIQAMSDFTEPIGPGYWDRA